MGQGWGVEATAARAAAKPCPQCRTARKYHRLGWVEQCCFPCSLVLFLLPPPPNRCHVFLNSLMSASVHIYIHVPSVKPLQVSFVYHVGALCLAEDGLEFLNLSFPGAGISGDDTTPDSSHFYLRMPLLLESASLLDQSSTAIDSVWWKPGTYVPAHMGR